MLPKINSAHGADTRNIINAAIDSINAQGKSIQDLVADGQLTPEQYEQLLRVVNGNAKEEDMRSLEKRFDEIITHPTENITQQEIIDARQGKQSLGSNLIDIRSMITNSALNLVSNGNFEDVDKNWGGSAETSIADGELSITYAGTTRYYRAENPEQPKAQPKLGDVLYARCQFHSDNLSNMDWLAFASDRTNTGHRFEPYFDLITGEWTNQSAVIVNEIEDYEHSDNGIYVKGQVTTAGQPSGTTFKVKNLMWLNLTDMYGVGNEPTKEEVDELFEKHQLPYWEDYFMIDQFYLMTLIDSASQSGGGQSEEEKKLEDMMWTWHTFPMSIYSEKAEKTFLGGVKRGVGGAGNGHNIYSIDYNTGDIEGNQLSNRFGGDDHNMVAFADRPTQSKVMAFYAGHSGDGIYYKYINDYNINNLSSEYKIPNSEGTTYINVHHGLENETMYIITRVANSGITIFYTDDWGDTWNSRQLFSGNNYVDTGKSHRRNRELGITVTGHGGTGWSEIYYCYLHLDGMMYLPDGTQIADVKTGQNLPLDPQTDLKLVTPATGSKTTVTSVNSQNHNLTFIDAPDDENFETFNYQYAIYNSDTDTFDIIEIESGVKGNLSVESHPHYVGSCTNVGFRFPIIYFSNFNDATNEWEIWEYASMSDRPSTWNKTLMDKDTLKLFRPITTMADDTLRKPIPGFWLRGYFSNYMDYYAHAQIPFNMDI